MYIYICIYTGFSLLGGMEGVLSHQPNICSSPHLEKFPSRLPLPPKVNPSWPH